MAAIGGADSGSTRANPFEALAGPDRRAIVELLGSGGRSVRELADALPISRPAVSRHLRLLKDAGPVTEQPLGTRRIYRLHDRGIEAVQAYLERVWGEAAVRFRLLAENTAPPADAAPPPICYTVPSWPASVLPCGGSRTLRW